MNKITKLTIPIGGLGTRVLLVTKEILKEV